MLVKCCGTFGTLVISGLIIGFGIAFLIQAKDFIDAKFYMWYWCIFEVCLVFASTLDFIIMLYVKSAMEGISMKAAKNLVSPLGWIFFICHIGMFCFGSYIHYNLIHTFVNYPIPLWILFQILFITLCVSIAIFACGISLAICGYATGYDMAINGNPTVNC